MIVQRTTLERQHAAFVMALSHRAHRLISVRPLDSGAASDVSGVIQTSFGGPDVLERPGSEYLYTIATDGGITVMERGQ